MILSFISGLGQPVSVGSVTAGGALSGRMIQLQQAARPGARREAAQLRLNIQELGGSSQPVDLSWPFSFPVKPEEVRENKGRSSERAKARQEEPRREPESRGQAASDLRAMGGQRRRAAYADLG